MKRFLSGFILACTVVLLPQVVLAETTQDELNEIDRVIIKYNKNVQQFSRFSQENTDVYIDETQHYISLPKQLLSTKKVQQLIKKGDVQYIEADYKRHAYDLKSHITDWDTTSLGVENFTTQLKPKKEALIAVVDTGVDYNHPALKDYVVPGYDFVDDDNDAMDEQGHGTHVAGIALRGANYNNVKILPVRVLDKNGAGQDAQIASGIRYAVDQGANVINLSLGGDGISQTQRDAILYALDQQVNVIVASGNEDELIYNKYPASEREVLTVGASAKNKARANFSNYGVELDVMAPGQRIYSSFPRELDIEDGKRDGYAYLDGTSMATPFVSGIVGLIHASYPELTSEEIEVLLKSQAELPANVDFDEELGFGHLKADRFSVDQKAFLINTTFLTEGNDDVQIGVYGYDNHTVDVAVNNKNTVVKTTSGITHVPFAIEKQSEAMITATLRDSSGTIVETVTRAVPVVTQDIVVDIKNENNMAPTLMAASLYGEKDGVVEPLTRYIETSSKGTFALSTHPYDDFDQLYLTVVADGAFYTQKVDAEATVSLSPAQLKKVKVDNSVLQYPKEKRFNNIYAIAPPMHTTVAYMDDWAFPSMLPLNYLTNPYVYVNEGTYDFKFIDAGKNHAFLTMRAVPVTQNTTIDFKNAGYLQRVHLNGESILPIPIFQMYFEPVLPGQEPTMMGTPMGSNKPTYITRGTYDAYVHFYIMGIPLMSVKGEHVRITNNRTYNLFMEDDTLNMKIAN